VKRWRLSPARKSSYRLLTAMLPVPLLEICRERQSFEPHRRRDRLERNILRRLHGAGRLAHHVGMSPASFHHALQSGSGMTPIHYQKAFACKKARKVCSRLDRNGEASFPRRVIKVILSSAKTIANISGAFRRTTFGRTPARNTLSRHITPEIPVPSTRSSLERRAASLRLVIWV